MIESTKRLLNSDMVLDYSTNERGAKWWTLRRLNEDHRGVHIQRDELEALHALIGSMLGLGSNRLPDEAPEGFVRCRAAVATDEQGNACVYGFDFTDHEGAPDVGDWQDVTRESVFSRRNHSGAVLNSFVTFDAPKPHPPAEVVGTVVTND